MTPVQSFADKKVLAVDDDPIIRKMFSTMLKNLNFQVQTAVNGADAVTKALQFGPDIIFMDVMMPEVDGFKALEMLRNMERFKFTPIIMVTARADTETLLQAIKYGANDFIAKPFSRGMILRKVKYALAVDEEAEGGTAEPGESEKRTFVRSGQFLELKHRFINRFDQIFLKLIRLISQQDKAALLTQLNDIKNSCRNFDLQGPMPLAQRIIEHAEANRWDGVTNDLVKLYEVFQELQKSIEQHP